MPRRRTDIMDTRIKYKENIERNCEQQGHPNQKENQNTQEVRGNLGNHKKCNFKDDRRNSRSWQEA